MIQSQDPEGEWLPKTLVASLLGVSERTIERRVAQGVLAKNVRAGGQVEIWLPTELVDENRPSITAILTAQSERLLARRAQVQLELIELQRLKERIQSARNGRTDAERQPAMTRIETLSKKLQSLLQEWEDLTREAEELTVTLE